MRKSQKVNDFFLKNVEKSTEFHYGDNITNMKQNPIPIISPILQNHQNHEPFSFILTPSSSKDRSIFSKPRNDLMVKEDIAEMVTARPIETAEVSYPSRVNNDPLPHTSRKTINIGEIKEQIEYTTHTFNQKRSKCIQIYQATSISQDQDTFLDNSMRCGSFFVPEQVPYSMLTEPEPNVKSSFSQIERTLRNEKEVLLAMEINSPLGKGYEYNNTKVDCSRRVMGKKVGVCNFNSNNIEFKMNHEQNYLQTEETVATNIKTSPTSEIINENEIKKFVKKISNVYDQRNAGEGDMIYEPQANLDEVFDDKGKVLQKMNKLSSVFLWKNKRGRALFSKLMINRKSRADLVKNSFDKNKLNRTNVNDNKLQFQNNQTNEQKPLNVSVALLNSRTIFKKMRLSKRGVVDLTQDENKRKGKYTIKSFKRKKRIGSKDKRPNPKFREKAAKVIQQWWRELQLRYKEIMKKIIIIQSWWRAKWLRMYLFDILYLTYLYQVFCQEMQRVFVKHVRSKVIEIFMKKKKKKVIGIKMNIPKENNIKMIKFKKFWDKWIDVCKAFKDSGIKKRKVARKEIENLKVKKAYDKWCYISNLLMKLKSDLKSKKKKLYGMIVLLNGSEKKETRVSLNPVKPKIKKYFIGLIRKKEIIKIFQIHCKMNKILMNYYFNKYKNKIAKIQMEEIKGKMLIDYVNQLIDINRFVSKFRNAIINPFIKKIHRTIVIKNKSDASKRTIIKTLRKNNENNLDYCLRKWKNNIKKKSDIEKERKFKVKILKYLISYINLKMDDNLKKREYKALLKWKYIFNDQSVIIKEEKEINSNINETMRNEELLNSNVKLISIFEKYLLYINSKLYEPANDLIEAMNAIHLLKTNNAITISNFCRGIINIKKQFDILKHNILLKKLLIGKNFYQLVKTRNVLTKWHRSIRFIKANDYALIIQSFIKTCLTNKQIKKDTLYKTAQLLNNCIYRVVLLKIKEFAKIKKLEQVAIKKIRNEGILNKKTLHDFYLRWKNRIPELREKDAAEKIQSTLRGQNIRRKFANAKTLDSKMQFLVNKLFDKYLNKTKVYLLKWLTQKEKEKVDYNVNLIQSYLQVHLINLQNKKSKDKLRDILRMYIISILANYIIKASKIQWNRGEIMYNTIENIFICKPFENIVNMLKWQGKAKTIKILLSRLHQSYRENYLPLYSKKWYDNTIGDRDRKTLKIQNWIRGRIALLKRKNDLRKDKLLSKYLLCKLTKDQEMQKKIPFLYWDKLTQYFKLNDTASAIQKMWRGWASRINTERSFAQNKLKDLFKAKVKNDISESIREVNINFYSPIINNLNIINSNIDIRYSINNIIDFSYETLGHHYLYKLIENKAFKDTKSLLHCYFDIWNNSKTKAKDSVIKIQKYYRGIKGRETYLKLNTIKNKIYEIALKYTNDAIAKKHIAFRNWSIIINEEICIEKSNLIKQWIIPKLLRYENNKIKNFYLSIAKLFAFKKLEIAGKLIILKNAMLIIPYRKFIIMLKDKIKEDNFKWKLVKGIRDIENSQGIMILGKYIELWIKKKNQFEQRDNEESIKIQSKYRQYLAKVYLNKLKAKNEKLLQVLMKLINNNERKIGIALILWNHKVKASEISDAKMIIFNFMEDILEKLRRKNTHNKIRKIKQGIKILEKLKYQKRLGLDGIKSEANINKFNNFNDITKKKKFNRLKTSYKAIKYKSKKNKILKNMVISFRKSKENIILKIFFLHYINQTKLITNDSINKSLNHIVKTLIIRKGGMISKYINKWSSNIKKHNLLISGKIIDGFLYRSLKKSKSRIQWIKLSDLLALNNGRYEILHLYKRIKLFFGIKKLSKPFDNSTKRNGFIILKSQNKKRKLYNKMSTIVNYYINKNDLTSMVNAFNKFKNITHKLIKKDESIALFVTPIWKRFIIISFNRINSAFLIKNLFHDILLIRAMDFYNKIRKINTMTRKRYKFGKFLYRSKIIINVKRSNCLKDKIYKIFIYKILDKFVNKIKKIQIKDKVPITTKFFDKIKKLYTDKGEYYYKSKLSINRQCPKRNFSFSSSISKQTQFSIEHDNIDVCKLLLPYLLNYLQRKINCRRKFALNKITIYTKSQIFWELINKYSNKKILPLKPNLLNNLKDIKYYEDTMGEKQLQLFLLLRKYFILKLLCSNLTEPSRLYRLLYLCNLSIMMISIEDQRIIRELVRKWKFYTFVQKITQKKLDIIYQSFHSNYTQMVNEVFSEQESSNLSVMKEFEKFGIGIGMFVNENPCIKKESRFCKTVRKSYVFNSMAKEEKYEELGENMDFIIDDNINNFHTIGFYLPQTNIPKKIEEVKNEGNKYRIKNNDIGNVTKKKEK